MLFFVAVNHFFVFKLLFFSIELMSFCFTSSSNLVPMSSDHADAFPRVPEIYHTSTGISSINTGTGTIQGVFLTGMTCIGIYVNPSVLRPY